MKINLKTVRDDRYRFAYSFDLDTGFYYRTGIYDDAGKDTGKDPFRASYPHLLDVGIMGHCVHGASGLCVKLRTANLEKRFREVGLPHLSVAYSCMPLGVSIGRRSSELISWFPGTNRATN